MNAGYNAARLASLRTMYEIRLTNAVSDHPEQYGYPVSDVSMGLNTRGFQMAKPIDDDHVTPAMVLREVDVAGKYYLKTWFTGRVGPQGHNQIGYSFNTHARIEAGHFDLFCAEDIGMPAGQALDSDKTLVSVLKWLTLRKGDTDADYFTEYTEDQLEWRDSSECEELGNYVAVLDVPEAEEHRGLFFADYRRIEI